MNRVEPHNELSGDGSGLRPFIPLGSARFFTWIVAILMMSSAPSVLADEPVFGYVGSANVVDLGNRQTDDSVTAVRHKARYHHGLVDIELEQAVSRAAQQCQIQPALLLAVMKAESSFNPTVVSRAGAVGLMQLIPETAIRHGVRNLYDTNDNITGGAKHLRYLLDRFHGNLRLAVAAYNAGERKVDRYGQIPPYKETQDYVKKVLVYYRGYKKDGWVMPVVMTDPPLHAGQRY
jgi:soluble lytic murein transglycosylase